LSGRSAGSTRWKRASLAWTSARGDSDANHCQDALEYARLPQRSVAHEPGKDAFPHRQARRPPGTTRTTCRSVEAIASLRKPLPAAPAIPAGLEAPAHRQAGCPPGTTRTTCRSVEAIPSLCLLLQPFPPGWKPRLTGRQDARRHIPLGSLDSRSQRGQQR
jgi:hypothetical protein